MVDDWENWEDVEIDNFIVTFPISDINSKEEKQLEERKLVEEADNALSKELFGTERDLQNEKMRVIQDIKVVAPQKIKLSKQKENEQKQKEFSKKVKELKMKQKRFNELYGESNNNYKYDEYDDKYHN
jgi:hypothetical protein